MKAKHLHVLTFGALGLVVPASADVIHSNLHDIGIPANFDGLYLDVNGTNGWNTSIASPVAGWDINPFYGGKVLANSPDFQPVRATTGNTSPVVDLAAGVGVGSGSTYSIFVQGAGGETPGAPGYGTSRMLTDSGGNFTPGTEGYIGFKLHTDASYTVANYGWMRVVLGGATPVIKDWAYDTGGVPIVTGNVLQSGATITLDSVGGSFTLGSQITGSNSVVVNGANTVTLTGTNSYTGSTTIHAGTLKLDASASIANSTRIIVGDAGSSAAVLDVSSKTGGFSVGGTQTLGGTGSITGSVTINGGILAPGNSVGSLTVTRDLTLNTGSTFAYEMNSSAVPSVAADFQKVFGNLDLSGLVNLTLTDLASSPAAFSRNTTLSLINYAGTWNAGFFTYAGNELDNHEVFTAGHNTWQINYDAISGGLNFATEYTGGHFVTLTAVPESGSWLALGCLLGSGTFLRRRYR